MTSTGPGDFREDGPFVLRSLLDEVPLSADGTQDNIKINCVDYFDRNLYVGTLASELLHFVQIPPDPADKFGRPIYILASRLSPTYNEPPGTPASALPGVQQILLLPRAGKACILCNWTVTFYSLPELSPVYGTTIVKNCNWIGGVDLNEPVCDDGNAQRDSGVTILLSLNRRIQVVRIGDDARLFKKIDFPGSTLSVRRDSIACVADSKSYSLLDVDQQLKIPLMSISSLDEQPPPEEIGHAQSIATDTSGGISRSASSSQNRPVSSQGHSRSASLGGSILGNVRRQDQQGSEAEEPVFQEPSTAQSSGEAPSRSSLDKPLPTAPSMSGTPSQAASLRPKPGPVFLKPHIASPGPGEFLLVTGTSPLEPGIGMFVNLDGEPSRPTLEFDRYPKEVVIDGAPADLASSKSGLPNEEEGYVLASTAKEFADGLHHGIEIQPLEAGSDANPQKFWLEAEGTDKAAAYGIRPLVGREETQFQEIVERLCLRRISPFSTTPPEASTSSLKTSDSRTALSIERLSKEKELFEQNFDSQDEEPLPEGWESRRNAEGEEFARRLASAQARLAVWSGNRIWWAIRNPLLIQLDTALDAACPKGWGETTHINRRAVITTLNSIRGRDARTELEFMTFEYIRQKAGVLLLTCLLQLPNEEYFSETEMKALEEVLIDSGLDARVVLSLVPGVRNEIIEGRRGIWIYGGVKKTADAYLQSDNFLMTVKAPVGSLPPRTMHFLRAYLNACRKKKGFGSVPDERSVFRTVDAALLLVLLEIDQHSPKGLGKGGVVRSELYELVDKGVDDFDRAVDLLESYHRLFVLSRLYQSRKMAGDVLATWKRIVEGERDDGQELRDDGEMRVREYLAKISSQALVKEYGVWLATRNPRLGVQVFAEDQGRAPKFEPPEVVDILKKEAPDAVKYYLEHLVFGKGQNTYVDDLITYYLDIVVSDLESSSISRDTVMATYDAYRALQAPKPTYRHFLDDNAPPGDEVWHSRLRLLQLLGGDHNYDAGAIRQRLSNLPADLLVPETIILAGREQQHEDAVRLLVHSLGDYDTAISYCLRGGAALSTFAPPAPSFSSPEQQRPLFHYLLGEFLSLSDVSARVEQTGALLERFGGWFDVDDVLDLIPDDWSVDIVAGFLVGALKRLIVERRQSVLKRALSGAQNLRVNYDLVMSIEEKGPSIEVPD